MELVIPVVGHAYAGDACAGLTPALVSGAGLVGVVVGLNLSVTDCETLSGFEFCTTSANGTVVALGWLTYLGGRAWGVVSTFDTVRRFNRDLEQRLGISLERVDPILKPSSHGVSVGLSVRLGK